VTFSLRQVRRRFEGRAGPVAALDGVSLEVAPGERLVVLGPSGAGKTTLFGLLNTTLRPTEGTVQFEGKDVAGLSRRPLRAARRHIGTVFQQPRLVPSLSVRQNALLFWSLVGSGLGAAAAREEARRATASTTTRW